MRFKPEITSLLIQKLGYKMIKDIYSIIGAEPVSFSLLFRSAKHEKIKQELKTGMTVSQIAKQNSVSKMTVYRLMKSK